jgi:hypothetical protein
MPSPFRVPAAVALLALVTACGTSDRGLSDDLQRDLGEVRASSVELAPRASDVRQVVSAEEQLPAGRVARATASPAARSGTASKPRARATPVVAAAEPAVAPVPRETSVDVAQSPRTLDTAPVASAPRPRPVEPASGRRGGYKTVGEIIRDAPFPINP